MLRSAAFWRGFIFIFIKRVFLLPPCFALEKEKPPDGLRFYD
jgi:hypothetical protein